MTQDQLRMRLADYTSGDSNIADLQSDAESTSGRLADRILGALTEYRSTGEDEGALRARLSPLVREFAAIQTETAEMPLVRPTPRLALA